MTAIPKVLIVDDQPGDIGWLVDRIAERGYEIEWATNERAAREHLQAVKDGREEYVAAIFDVMVVLVDLEDLMELDEMFFVESKDTGIRLARFARKELGISERQLPIASLTIRDDDPVKTAMKELGIPLFHRTPKFTRIPARQTPFRPVINRQ